MKDLPQDELKHMLNGLYQGLKLLESNILELEARLKVLENLKKLQKKREPIVYQYINKYLMIDYLGISDSTFKRLLKNGDIVRKSRGIYALNEATRDDLLSRYAGREPKQPTAPLNTSKIARVRLASEGL